jgi:hypothetical protein
VLLSKLNAHCHCAYYIEKNKYLKIFFKTFPTYVDPTAEEDASEFEAGQKG